LGIPFSDPLADGPTIQNATLRAFAAGVTPTQCFEMLAAIRQKHPTIPIGLLMYANLVFNRGIDEFYAECARGCRLRSGGRRTGRVCAVPSGGDAP
jgi:tryptophan synthase alpha chain